MTCDPGHVVLIPFPCPAAVYRVELYTDDQVAEFLASDAAGPEREERLRRALGSTK